MRLKNRVALVTGAASDIGKKMKIARAFVREGARWPLPISIKHGANGSVAAVCGPEQRAIGIAYGPDLRSAGQSRLDQGRLDVLVSNAGTKSWPRWTSSPSPSGRRLVSRWG
jgi:NAD(P)-dependent dehydrogenase (short-subunit alcohol dehydrogenase family)